MSSALAIAAVTATLKDLLNEGLLNHDLSSVGSFSVTAQPPDRITTGNTESNQLNIFLYQVTPNLGWRNVGQPSHDNRGGKLSNPPLALDLHYLISAYGAEDMNAEVLLGFAMQLLHETPVLTRGQLRTVLGPPSLVDGTILPGPFGNLSALDLADQVELIKITPDFLSAEELSKLWTAMQARYRPSMAYLVSVVLIQSEGGAAAAPPVLQRGGADRGPTAQALPPPVLHAVRHAIAPLLPALRLGDDIALFGGALAQWAGVSTAVFECSRLAIVRDLAVGAGPDVNELRAHIPSVAEQPAAIADWGIGLYAVALRVQTPGQPVWTTNAVPVALSPRITVAPLTAPAGVQVDLTITCAPRLLPQQQAMARLLFGTVEVLPAAVTTPADASLPTTLQFSVPGQAAGDYPVRLRIDGLDSLPITISATPPAFAFDPAQTVKLS